MGRIIELSCNGKEYKLEFSYKSLLKVDGIQKELKKAKTPYELFDAYGKLVRIAFEKNHPDISDEEFEEVLTCVGNLEEFSKAILTIIQESVSVFQKKQGNAHWEVK